MSFKLRSVCFASFRFPGKPGNRDRWAIFVMPGMMENHGIWGYSGTAGKNRFRFFQPTLGFLSAKGGKYGNYKRGNPQVLNRLVLSRFRKELVGKNFSGPEKFFQVQPSKTTACQGLKVYCGMVLDCARGGGRKNLSGPEKLFVDLGARSKAAQARPHF